MISSIMLFINVIGCERLKRSKPQADEGPVVNKVKEVSDET